MAFGVSSGACGWALHAQQPWGSRRPVQELGGRHSWDSKRRQQEAGLKPASLPPPLPSRAPIRGWGGVFCSSLLCPTPLPFHWLLPPSSQSSFPKCPPAPTSPRVNLGGSLLPMSQPSSSAELQVHPNPSPPNVCPPSPCQPASVWGPLLFRQSLPSHTFVHSVSWNALQTCSPANSYSPCKTSPTCSHLKPYALSPRCDAVFSEHTELALTLPVQFCLGTCRWPADLGCVEEG